MKVKVFTRMVHVSAHVQKVLSFSLSKNSVSNYAGLRTLIREYFNYPIGRHVLQKVYFHACFIIRLCMYTDVYDIYFSSVFSNYKINKG